MNICVISFHCCPFSPLGGDGKGGMNVYLRELSSTITHFPDVNLDIFTRIQSPKIRGIRNISPRVRVVHLKGGPEHPVNRNNLYDFLPEFSRNLDEFISQEKISYDIVYSHYWLSGLVGELVRERYNLPLIHIFHTLAFLKKRLTKQKYEEHSKRLSAEEHLAHTSEAIISSSEQEEKNLLEEYKISSSKIKVIYPGVNKELFYPIDRRIAREKLGCGNDEKIVLYVGRIEPVKGLFTLIESLKLLRREASLLSDQLKLIIIGGGSKSSDHLRNREILHLRSMTKAYDLGDRVFFLGSKKQNMLKEYYSAADLLVIPSLYEAFGLVVLEALACGTPVIASKIGEMRSIIKEGKNGLHFTPGNSSSLSSCLQYFFSPKSNLWNRERIRRNIIHRFSWEKTAEETYDFFRSIIKKQSRFPTTISQFGESPQPA